jgi:hypothetical protein
MTRAAAIMLGGLAASLVATARPPDAAASVLCQVRKKALVVRDQCKAREEPLTPERQAELGLVGAPGPSGPPGPSTGTLHVIDAVGRDVGVVIRADTYYGSTVQIVGQMTLPGRSAPQFVIGQVDGNGLQSDFSCRDTANYYETPTCEGQAYADCRFGDCEAIPGTYFAQPILHQSSTTGCFFGEPSETKEGDFFRRVRTTGRSVLEVNQQCRFGRGGTLVSVPVECKRGLLCADCCVPAPGRSLIPVHSFDASLLGTPRFRLAR